MTPFTPSRRALWLFIFSALGTIAALFAACTGRPPLVEPTATPTRTPRPTATPAPTPTPTPAWPVTVYAAPELPAPVAVALDAAFAAHPDFLVPALDPAAADVQVTLTTGSNAPLIAEWVYVVAAPFPTIPDEVTWADVVNNWRGSPSGPFAGRPLLMEADTLRALTVILGAPAEGAVSTPSGMPVVDVAWANRPSWAIVPFDQLEPRWKALRVDGASALDRALDTSAYPLVVRVGATGSAHGIAKLQELLGAPLTNRDPNKISVIAMTGVTAMGRCTAATMDVQGVTYPGEAIRPWLLAADITHVSNEVSFSDSCSQACVDSVVFCSKPSYIGLFEDLDIDVIELTGNHLLDWGMAAMEQSLRMYDERGIPYFGGGWNLEQAMRPAVITHGVHTFGFVGCNPVGPPADWATATSAGSAPCPGYDYTWLVNRIVELRAQGIIPIVTLQYWEFDQFEPTPQQRADFRALSAAGAEIVSGSQAHYPQGFDFQNGLFIHYGLGNLFFDQTQLVEYRQGFVDWHVFYDGRHISTELLTIMRDDYARPRPMTPAEREAFLQKIFAASGW